MTDELADFMAWLKEQDGVLAKAVLAASIEINSEVGDHFVAQFDAARDRRKKKYSIK